MPLSDNLRDAFADEARQVAESAGVEIDEELDDKENAEGDTDFRCLGEGVTDQELAHAPEWDCPLLEMYQGVTDPDSDPNRALVDFSASGTPEFVLERIREAIMGGAMFSDFEDIPSSELMDFRQTFADAVGTDNFTLDSVTDAVMTLAILTGNEPSV